MEQTDRLGFIHEKLDIKLLILFVLSRLPKPVGFDTLTDLVMVDDGFDYFEYTQCLDELVRSENVEKQGTSYQITRMGKVNEDTVESSVPYSVRLKAENKARPLVEKMKRDALIGTRTSAQKTAAPTFGFRFRTASGRSSRCPCSWRTTSRQRRSKQTSAKTRRTPIKRSSPCCRRSREKNSNSHIGG